MADYQPYPIVPPLPDYEKKKEEEKARADELAQIQRVLAPEQKEVNAKGDLLLAQQEALAGKDAAQQSKVADIKSQNADDEQKAAAQIQRERDAALAASHEATESWKSRLTAAQAKYDAAPTPSLFGGDGSTTSKVLRGFALTLAGYADARSKQALVRAGMNPGTADPVGDMIKTHMDGE